MVSEKSRDDAQAELEAQKKTINERYDDLETAYKDFLKSIKEKTRGIGEILQDIWKNATPELRQIIQENAELFKQFGFDVSQLSAAVNDTAKKMYGISKNGDKYEIGSDKGLDFINNKPAGSTMTGGDGSTWTKNEDGTVTIVDKDGVTYTVYPNGGSGGTFYRWLGFWPQIQWHRLCKAIGRKGRRLQDFQRERPVFPEQCTRR